ncbi:TIGR02808 family protein [Alkalimarinus alittae]|uniref:TIGR02808 family protein n=1 Tax=Alkalimarinus alittae TaxID=2961619 RepID=A0ABY6N2U4_9ALTE|nr:TIGR02808 family protein [Alkalimarinus alittae]UZE96432.1 TIGR02808 family protein [Alkalimarinus alittae]
MSPLESMIWTILGYAAMPTIFIVGFAVTAAVACFLLDITGNGEKE